MTASLEPGSKAPTFSAPATGGDRFDLTQHRGKTVVLFFYPKDDTTGCTQEATEFSTLADQFAALDAVVLGISRDSLKSHDRFIAKHGLTIPLATDEDGSIAGAYGVWVEKSMYGRKYMGMERSTFVVGPDGRLRGVFRKVKAAGHALQVLNHLRNT